MAREPLKCVGYISLKDGQTKPIEDMTAAERERVAKSMAERLGRSMSEYYSNHLEEYKKL